MASLSTKAGQMTWEALNEDWARATSLTGRDMYLLVVALNGLLLPLPYSAEQLAADIAGHAGVSHADHATHGRDLGGIAGDTSETPYHYHDLAEKIAKLTDLDATAIVGYAKGFWDGVAEKGRGDG
jgi:hypothetical protein